MSAQGLLVHGSCVAVRGAGLLLLGGSGAGKSDLALRLVDRGALLVADDQVVLRVSGGRLVASAPPRLAGLIEVRGLGILRLPACAGTPVLLALDLGAPPERLPPWPWPVRDLLGVALPCLPLSPWPASAPQLAELALARLLGEVELRA